MDGIHGHTLTITTKVVDGEPDEFGQQQYATRKTVLDGRFAHRMEWPHFPARFGGIRLCDA